jgi:isocitrate lyase
MKNLAQSNYSSALETVRDPKKKYGETWNAINPESAARMATQNRFKTGLDIAIYSSHYEKRYGSVRCRFISIYTI